jgi:hypothetical protein
MNNKGQAGGVIFFLVLGFVIYSICKNEPSMEKQQKEAEAAEAQKESTHVISTDADGNKLWRAYDSEKQEYVYYTVMRNSTSTQYDAGTTRRPDVKQVPATTSKNEFEQL